MKRTAMLIALAAACFALTVACQPAAVTGDDTSAADIKAAALMNALITANATGDFAPVEQILARDDVNGELRAVLTAHGALPQGPFAPLSFTGGGTPLPLPPYNATLYSNGDVMLCKGSGTFVSEMMRQMLVRGYGHSGILNADLANAGADNCVLSSDADYITGGGEALNYQSFLDWAGNDIVTVLHATSPVPTIAGNIGAIAANRDGGTVYAFLGYLGTPYASFQSIPRMDNDYWYCSKVPWRVYNNAGVNTEAAGFYDQAYQGAQRWTPFRESLLYQTYSVYVFITNPFKSSAWRKAKADAQVRSVLQELVTPDELRASPALTRAFTVTAGGVSYDPAFNDAASTGWSIPY
jgi:hypothetical protein